MSKGCGCCVDTRNERRDFRQDKGGGPEVAPHRAKSKGKKYCKRNKGPHVFDQWGEWKTYYSYRYRYRECKCGKQEWARGQSQYKQTGKHLDGTEFTYWA